jgi:hypothetical protein
MSGQSLGLDAFDAHLNIFENRKFAFFLGLRAQMVYRKSGKTFRSVVCVVSPRR